MQTGTMPAPRFWKEDPIVLSPSSPQAFSRVLQPTRIHAGPIRLLPLDRAALATLARPLHPALQGVRRFVEALLALSPAAARRLGTVRPEIWAAVTDDGDDSPIIGLGWLAGEATEVIAAPGRTHDEATRQLVDVLLHAARRRRLEALTARLSGPIDRDTTLTGLDARVVAERDGALFLHLDLTARPGD
jgi:hypothetical protein